MTIKHFFKQQQTKIYYGSVTFVLGLLFSWALISVNAIVMMPRRELMWFYLVPLHWLTWIGLVIGNALIVIWQVRIYRRTVSLDRLIEDLTKIADEGPDIAVDWNAPFAPRTQALINVSNRIAETTAHLRAEERASEQSKDEMITNISHDLRTPLTAIIGYLGLVEMGDRLSEADRRKYIHTAYDKSNQMKSLVEDLFEFSKTQTSDAVLNINQLSLSDLFAQLLASYEIDARDKNIELMQLTEPNLIIMEGDSDKLARALMNLIINALKYGEGATFIKLTAQVRGDQVEIRVSNNGVPIPQKDLKDIFDRFYRVESSRSSKTGGTGLGLAIVKGIIEQHAGSIYAQSNDEITSFVMTLPLTQRRTV